MASLASALAKEKVFVIESPPSDGENIDLKNKKRKNERKRVIPEIMEFNSST